MNLAALREARAAKVTDMRRLLTTAETEKRSLNAGEQASFDALKTEITGLETSEARATFLEDAERRSLGHVADKGIVSLEKQINLVDAINAQIENRALTGALAEYNAEQKRNGISAKGVLIPQSIFEKRAAQTTTTAAGIVPDDFRPEQFVGLLRNAALVQSLGARVLPNLRGDVVIPRQASTSTAQWIAEGGALTDSGMTFNNVKLAPKHVGALTELSRQLLQQGNPAIEQLVRDDFVQVVGLAIDKAMIHGDGVDEPEGLLTAVTGTGSLSTLTWAAVLAVMESLALQNVNPNNWLTHPKVATKLRSLLTTDGLPGWMLDDQGRLAGLNVAVTNQMDAKAGSPATGRIILGDFSEMIVGTWGAVDILANPYAEGPYSRGAVQVRILTTLDMIPRRENAFVVVDDIAI
jgi:HK97 family phage major capsid protein